MLTSTTSRPVIRSTAAITFSRTARGHVGDRDAVVDDDLQVERRLHLADLGLDAAGDRTGRRRAPGRAPRRSTGEAAAHGVDADHVPGRQSGDLLHHAVGDGGPPAGRRGRRAPSAAAGSRPAPAPVQVAALSVAHRRTSPSAVRSGRPLRSSPHRRYRPFALGCGTSDLLATARAPAPPPAGDAAVWAGRDCPESGRACRRGVRRVAADRWPGGTGTVGSGGCCRSAGPATARGSPSARRSGAATAPPGTSPGVRHRAGMRLAVADRRGGRRSPAVPRRRRAPCRRVPLRIDGGLRAPPRDRPAAATRADGTARTRCWATAAGRLGLRVAAVDLRVTGLLDEADDAARARALRAHAHAAVACGRTPPTATATGTARARRRLPDGRRRPASAGIEDRLASAAAAVPGVRDWRRPARRRRRPAIGAR